MAKITIVNEEGQNLNRYKMVPVAGQTDIYDLERAANITKQGTPFSPETMAHYTQDEDLVAHTSDADIHVTAEKKAAWDAGIVSTYIHTKNGTVHDLAGTGNNIEFLAKAEISDGDTWTVNGVAVTATLQNGDPLPDDLFKSGSWVTGVRLDGAKLGFKNAGGSIKYNVFCQPDEPPTKEGIWLKTAAVENIKKIVFDTNPFGAGKWLTPDGVADYPSAISDVTIGGIYNNKIYFIGASPKVFSYDVNINLWDNTSLRDMPTSVSGGVWSGQALAQIDDKIYIFAGRDFNSNNGGNGVPQTFAFCYNMSTNVFTRLTDFPSACYGLTACAINGKVYLFGGVWYDSNSTPHYLNKAVEFDPSTNTYKNIAIFPVSNFWITNCVAYNGEVFCFSGSSYAYAYNPVTNSYRTILATPRTNINQDKAVVVADEIYFIGGYLSTNYSPYLSVHAYKPATNTYRSLSDMPSTPVYSTHTESAVLLGNNIYSFCGGDSKRHKRMSLITKNYPDNNTAVIQYFPNDTSHVASLVTSKLCDYLPSYFKDAMLFKDGNLLYPELYTGDGTAWTKIREAQS